jgi:hypothetical protein
MSGADTVREKQWLVSSALGCIETDISGSRLVVAEDLRLRSDVHRDHMLEAWKVLEELLDDPGVSNADLKGLLNRVDVAWRVESPFGANAQAAREHLEAAKDAIQNWAEAL